MTGSLARYHARSPRYTLDTLDNNLVRYSGAERFSWEEKTELRNVSLTGLSFSAPCDLSPQIGEIIKIQFEVPGAEQMACYAVVIRIDSLNDFENEVAVHFYKLDRLQRINLVQGLAQKLSTQKKSDCRQEPRSHETLPNKIKHFYWGFAMLTSALIWITLLKEFWL